MSFIVPTIDDLLQSLLTDYSGQVDRDNNAIDISKGSMTFIDSSVLASALQGIYYRLKYTEQQALPNLSGAKTPAINKWAAIFGITRLSTDTDSDVIEKILTRIQQPPAGGNKNDWINWAKETVRTHHNLALANFTERIVDANVVENYRRPGSVDLYLLSDWSEFPQWDVVTMYQIGDHVKHTYDTAENIYVALLDHYGHVPNNSTIYWKMLGGCTDVIADDAKTKIENEKRPLGIWDNEYKAVTLTPMDVHIEVTGSFTISEFALEDIIKSYIDASKIGQTISLSRLTALMDEAGAETVVILNPEVNYDTGDGEKVIPGLVWVYIV
jgi:uncharacterized phage protein gp47/JayE